MVCRRAAVFYYMEMVKIMESGNVVVLSKDNFGEIVNTKDKIVLVDFWAPWCMPCRAVAPVLAKLAGEYPDNLIVGKLNVDEQQEIAFEHKITSIPTIQIYKNGKIADAMVGARPYADFKAAIEKHIK
jgi:thioredoxin